MLKTTANKITVFRILLVPVFLVLCYSGKRIPALIVFLVASLSDLADGYIARHYNQISDFGKFMDPLADKILVMAAMCYFVEVGRMPGWALAIVLLREFAVSVMRLFAVEQGRVIAAGWSGKVKTAAIIKIHHFAPLFYCGKKADELSAFIQSHIRKNIYLFPVATVF